MTRRRIPRRRIRKTFRAAAAAAPVPEGTPPLRFPAGVARVAAADVCSSWKFNGYYGDPPPRPRPNPYPYNVVQRIEIRQEIGI